MGGYYREMPKPLDEPQLVPGDKVTFKIPGSPDYDPGREYLVIGYPYWATGKTVVIIADKTSYGMPIYVGHCTVVGKGNEFLIEAREYRMRYESLFPDQLLPLR